MRYELVVSSVIQGWHCWPDAPEQFSWLRVTHPHSFTVRAWFEVDHAQRQLELVKLQHNLTNHIYRCFGMPAKFGSMSCEQIAEWVIKVTGCVCCEVLEDGINGALVSSDEGEQQ